MTYYDILGVPQTATQEEIKHAYRLQIRFFHPDVFQESEDVARIKTLQLNEAYEVLGNPDRRAKYDSLLSQKASPKVSYEAPRQPQTHQTQSSFHASTFHASNEYAQNRRYSSQQTSFHNQSSSSADSRSVVSKQEKRILYFSGVSFVLIILFVIVYTIICRVNSTNINIVSPSSQNISVSSSSSSDLESNSTIDSSDINTDISKSPTYPEPDDASSKENSTHVEIPEDTSSSNSTVSTNPEVSYVSVPFSNGEIVLYPASEQICPLDVSVLGSNSYYIYLKSIDFPSSNSMAFMVKPSSIASVDVPLGRYELYYATGASWYGTEHYFGDDTQFYKSDDILDFYEEGGYVYGYTLELYLQPNGNFSTEEIEADDFPE